MQKIANLPEGKYRAGILGATGAVGQRFIELLESNPWIEVTALGASSRSSGKTYAEATNWRINSKLPSYVRNMPVYDVFDISSFIGKVDIVFSGLDSSVAGEVEELFAKNGIAVFSNAKNYRMHPNVPILIPLINPEHIDLIKTQTWYQSCGGFIITNANCSSTGLAIALKPLHEEFSGITSYVACTLQAVSGAGYPGLPAIDCIDNIIPYISGEEDKIETEPQKILGVYEENTIKFVPMIGTAMCHRVPVSDGHTVSVSLSFKGDFDAATAVERATKALSNYIPSAEVVQLPSCPPQAVIVREEDDRPQPRLDRWEGKGQSAVVGRVRTCGVNHLKLTVLSHNTIVGAAGGSILNAELAILRGLVNKRVQN